MISSKTAFTSGDASSALGSATIGLRPDCANSRGSRRPSATALSAWLVPATYATSYQIRSSPSPCSFPAALWATVQYSQTLIALTVAAIISFCARVSAPSDIARRDARP